MRNLTSKPTTSILELGSDFYDIVTPAKFPRLTLRYTNPAAAERLNLHLEDSDYLRHFGEFYPLPGSLSQPLALRYHGHQFQSYNPELGDGRGFLFAQYQNSQLLDLGTKGSGTTPYSRGGDGRLTLKGAVREALATEYLRFQGVPTSETFCFLETHEELVRHDEPSPTRSAVLTRLSHSHIRFGTFQRLAYLRQADNIQKLLHYCTQHYYPHLENYEETEQAQAFLESVAERHGETTAAWMIAGFVHGVLNTDNMNITGESFDYGPYRFLPSYIPEFTAAYFDYSGLYSYGRQPATIIWNLTQLCEALKVRYPQLHNPSVMESFTDSFNYHLQSRLLRKLNLKASDQDFHDGKVSSLLKTTFKVLQKSQAPFEQFFFNLHSKKFKEDPHLSPEQVTQLQQELAKFQVDSPTLADHPYFRQSHAQTLLIGEIEDIWSDISTRDDWTMFNHKIQTLRQYSGIYNK